MDLSGGKRDPDRTLLDRHGGRPEPQVPRADLVGLGVDPGDGAVRQFATHTRFSPNAIPVGPLPTGIASPARRGPRRPA